MSPSMGSRARFCVVRNEGISLLVCRPGAWGEDDTIDVDNGCQVSIQYGPGAHVRNARLRRRMEPVCDPGAPAQLVEDAAGTVDQRILSVVHLCAAEQAGYS